MLQAGRGAADLAGSRRGTSHLRGRELGRTRPTSTSPPSSCRSRPRGRGHLRWVEHPLPTAPAGLVRAAVASRGGRLDRRRPWPGRAAAAPAPSVPVKVWSLSAVLRVPTDGGPVLLKATCDHFRSEPRITDLLGRLLPGRVPALLGHEPDRGWQLMEPLGGVSDEDEPTAGLAAPTAAAIAAIQLDCVPHVAQLRAAGCPDRGLESSLAAFRDVLASSPSCGRSMPTSWRRPAPACPRSSGGWPSWRRTTSRRRSSTATCTSATSPTTTAARRVRLVRRQRGSPVRRPGHAGEVLAARPSTTAWSRRTSRPGATRSPGADLDRAVALCRRRRGRSSRRSPTTGSRPPRRRRRSGDRRRRRAHAAAAGRALSPADPSALVGPPGEQGGAGGVLAHRALVQAQLEEEPVGLADLGPGGMPRISMIWVPSRSGRIEASSSSSDSRAIRDSSSS